MFSYIQIFLCTISLCCFTCKPIFGEIGWKKNFEVMYKPIPLPPLKPIGLIKELWTPFGHFGHKHGIARRDLDNMKTVEVENMSPMPPPVLTENRYEVEEPKLGPVPFPPQPVKSIPIMQGAGPGIGPVMFSPVPAPPPPVVVITPPPPKERMPFKEETSGLYTDIGRDELINEYLKSFEELKPISENNIAPEKPKNDLSFPPPPFVEETPSPFVRGSRLALYFGNILLEVLSKFLGGAEGGKVIDKPVII